MALAAAVVAMFTLSSPAFGNGGTMPRRYTCDGADVSPALRWTAPPPGTRTFSLSVIDVDAGNVKLFFHWQVTGISSRVRSIPVGGHVGKEALNGFGTRGWSGPCPPRGPAHRYIFVLRALDGHGRELGEAGVMGRYARR